MTWVLPSGRRYGQLTGLAHLGQALGQAVRGPDRERHQVGRLVAGVPEHHSLVAGTLGVELVLAGLAAAQLLGGVDALGDVGALLVDRDDHAAGVAVEPVERVVVTDLLDRLASDLGDVDVGVGGDLAGDHAQPRGDECLAGDTPVRIDSENRVENRVADLVGHLVGVTLGHALGTECPTSHWCFLDS